MLEKDKVLIDRQTLKDVMVIWNKIAFKGSTEGMDQDNLKRLSMEMAKVVYA